MEGYLRHSSVSTSRQKTWPAMSVVVVPIGRKTLLYLFALPGVLLRPPSTLLVTVKTASDSLTAPDELPRLTLPTAYERTSVDATKPIS